MDSTAIDGLVIVTIAKSEHPCITEILTAITQVEVSLQQCHTQVLDEMTVLTLHVIGHWHALAKLEINLPALAQKHGYQVLLHRSATDNPASDLRLGKIPYSIEWANLASAEIILTFCTFFNDLDIEVYDIHLQNVYTNPLGIGVAVSNMRILLPADMDPTSLREQFSLLCESMSLDAYLEPDHH